MAGYPSAAVRAQRQKHNENAAVYFAAGILAVIALITIIHWTSAIVSRTRSPKTNIATKTLQSLRRLLLAPVPVFSTLLNFLLFLAYLAINLAIIFTHIPWPDPSKRFITFAQRAGWATAVNIALTTLLSLRNTPLSFLTGASYERLRPLHIYAGYTTAVLLVIHGASQIAFFTQIHALSENFGPHEVANRMGAVAGVALLLTTLTATTLRRWKYEAFYVAHVVLFILIVVAYALHRPSPATHSMYIAVFVGAIWILDRAVRALTLLLSLPNNSVTIHALPHRGVRLTLSKPPTSLASLLTSSATRAAQVSAGKHIYLYIPALAPLETHPFTLSSARPDRPATLTIKAHDGFTRALYAHALAHPGASLRAGIDGPYGRLPAFETYDKVLLVAGGSGASFAMGVASGIAESESEAAARAKVELVWCVRRGETLGWFGAQIAALNAAERVSLRAYVTGEVGSASSSVPDLEKTAFGDDGMTPASTLSKDIEKDGRGSEDAESTKGVERVQYGRPDIEAVVREAVEGMKTGERVIVASCGPEGLMRDVRAATRVAMKNGRGVGVELYEETFGW